MGDEAFFAQFAEWQIGRVCKRCFKGYVEVENLGRWKCTMHPCDVNAVWPGEHYGKGARDCCGKQTSEPSEHKTYEPGPVRGCVAQDHTTKLGGAQYQEDDDLVVPLQFVGLLPQLYAESARVDTKRSVVVIRRFNDAAARERQAYGQTITERVNDLPHTPIDQPSQ